LKLRKPSFLGSSSRFVGLGTPSFRENVRKGREMESPIGPFCRVPRSTRDSGALGRDSGQPPKWSCQSLNGGVPYPNQLADGREYVIVDLRYPPLLLVPRRQKRAPIPLLDLMVPFPAFSLFLAARPGHRDKAPLVSDQSSARVPRSARDAGALGRDSGQAPKWFCQSLNGGVPFPDQLAFEQERSPVNLDSEPLPFVKTRGRGRGWRVL
jgi:hypothetical protein